MHRVTEIKPAGSFGATVRDRVVLDAGDRNRRRIVLTGEGGLRFLLDLEKPASLRDGDALVLDDGSVVVVAGRAETLAEIAAPSPRDFVRIAWHLGNRHADVQIIGNRIRIRRDHVLEDMVRGLGGTVTPLEAPFDPVPPAPGEPGHHDHAQGGLGHSHHHHHDHACGCGADHDLGHAHPHGHKHD